MTIPSIIIEKTKKKRKTEKRKNIYMLSSVPIGILPFLVSIFTQPPPPKPKLWTRGIKVSLAPQTVPPRGCRSMFNASGCRGNEILCNLSFLSGSISTRDAVLLLLLLLYSCFCFVVVLYLCFWLVVVFVFKIRWFVVVCVFVFLIGCFCCCIRVTDSYQI